MAEMLNMKLVPMSAWGSNVYFDLSVPPYRQPNPRKKSLYDEMPSWFAKIRAQEEAKRKNIASLDELVQAHAAYRKQQQL